MRKDEIMNILMVDDDKYVLEGLRNGLDWNSLPFDNRYEARNVAEAKKILSEIPIQILLCDIDMPKETGLDLLEWLRNRSSNLQVIFLTSYADFNYAKRALQLGSFDYFLKPIKYDQLAQILIDASNKVDELDSKETYEKYGKYWLESTENRKETFWGRMLHLPSPDSEKIEQLKEKYGLEYAGKDFFVIMAFHVKSNASRDWRDDNMVRYRLQNLMDAQSLLLATPLLQKECLMQENSRLWYSIYRVSGDAHEYWKQLSNVASTIRKQLKNDFSEFAVYFSQEANLCEIYKQAQRISLMMFNNIIYGNGIFFVVDYQPVNDRQIVLDKGQIEGYLTQQNLSALMIYINQNIRSIAEKNLEPFTASRSLIAQWTQIIYLYLDKNQVSANDLFSNDEYKTLYKNTVNSFSECQLYLQSMVSIAMDYVKQIQLSKNLISKVQEFIQLHLGENLSRASLGEAFYLNPDYLANTFKNTTGISLIKYINESRLKKAHELLLTTNEPIYTISISVGYPNSSYFSKQFRKEFGYGPSDLRSQNGKL